MVPKAAESHGLSLERLEQVEDACRRHIDGGSVAGVVTAVARHGKAAYLRSVGAQDIERDIPMGGDTVFRVFSMTKPVTCVCVLILFEEGKLRLTDPVSRFFSHFRSMRVYQAGDQPPFETVEAEREITIWDLMTHTAGLAYGTGDPHPAEQAFREAVWRPLHQDPDLDLGFLAEIVAEQPLVHQPGTQWRYSIANDLLAAVIERASGIGFAEFLEERVTAPLGMSDTGFSVHPESRSRLATPYQMQDDGTLASAEDHELMAVLRSSAHPSGGAGLFSTAGDYLRFAMMLAAGGSLDGSRILAPPTVDLMVRNHLPAPIVAGRGSGYGLGVEVLTDLTDHKGHGGLGRYGWTGAASTYFRVDPVYDLVLVIMLQLLPGFCRPIVDDVHTAVYQAIVG